MTAVRRARWLPLPLVLLALAGCSHTERGMVAGGAIGSAIGAVAGGPCRSGAGAVVGGLAGAAIGGAAGSAADRRERRLDAMAAAQARPPLSVQDVIQLTGSGMSDDVIITQIRTSGSIYHLGTNDLLALQNGGVREPVIREMQATVHRPLRRVYVVEPPPPPPIGFGVAVYPR